jgi:hypothetical protein
MRRIGVAALLCLLTVGAVTRRAQRAEGAESRGTVTTHDLIVVYLSTQGVNYSPEYRASIRSIRDSVTKRINRVEQRLVMRGVSLEPRPEDGLRDMADLGRFDELSVGGNWTNLAVVRYLGPVMGIPHSGIPQIVLLEREIIHDDAAKLTVGEERELRRIEGTADILAWIKRGAPIRP